MDNTDSLTQNYEFNNKSESEQSAQQNNEELDSPVGSYQQLLNELKMKSSALAKASNLIQILQLELEVQKNLKNQAVLAAQQEVQKFYENQIAILNKKNQMLQANARKRNRSVMLSTENSTTENKPKIESKLLTRTNSASRILNRSKSKQNMRNSAYALSPKSQQNSIQLSLYRKMILEASIWDNSFIQEFEKAIRIDNTEIQSIMCKLEAANASMHKQQYSGYEPIKLCEIAKVDQTNKIVNRLCSIIQNMRIYQQQLEGIILGALSKINKLYQDKQVQIRETDWLRIKEQAIEVTSKWRQSSDSRFLRLKQQNKELREIIQEMIGLMNKKKGQSCYDFRSSPS